MKKSKNDLLQGTLDLLVLQSLSLGPLHGLGVSDRIAQITQNHFKVKPGSLFPALHRLEQQGWIKAEWKDSKHGRNAKFYALTREGRQQLERELTSWKRLSSAVGLLLKKA